MTLHPEQVRCFSRVFHQEDFDRFAALSGDDNPIHVDPAFAGRTRFGATVAHGMLLYGAVCATLGTEFPGPGTIQLEQALMFPTPTYAGEAVTIRLEVNEVRQDEGLAELGTVVVRSSGDKGLEGRTVVRLPGRRLSCGRRIPTGGDTPVPRERQQLKGLAVGQRADTRRTFTTGDLERYAALTGDTNPVHRDGGYARELGLEGRIVPGCLLGGLFSHLLGTQLPGRGTNYLKQWLVYPAPAYLDDPLTAAVEVVRIRPEKELVNLRTTCTNSAGRTVCEGEALVLVRNVEAG